jgi:hypothetical protein
MSTSEPHLSPYLLDSLRLGRVSEDAARAARSHLGDCATCRRLDDSLVADQRHFVEEVLPRSRGRLQARVEEAAGARSWRRWMLLTLAPVAFLVVLLVRPRPGEQGASPPLYQGEKGGSTFFVVGQREGRVFPVAGAGPLRAGDSIRFVVTSLMPYVMIASVDARGRAQVYAPFQGTQSAAVAVERRLELPEGGSIQLDATPGPERIFALFSRRPLAARVVLEALERLGARGPDAIRAGERLDLPAGAQLSELLEKAAR